SRRAAPRCSSTVWPVSRRSAGTRRSSRRPPWRWNPSSCSSSESTGPGGWPGSADHGRRSQLGGATAERPRARGVGPYRMAVDLAEPGRGDRPAPAAVLLPLLLAPDLRPFVLPSAGGRGHDLLHAEHRKLVP